MKNFARWIAAAMAALAGSTGANASDIQVPADQPGIQAGIDAAQAGDRVLVAPGTYAETIDFHGKEIQVIGVGGPSVTTIDARRTGPVVTFASGETRGAVLAGFSVIHGRCGASPGAGIRISGGASPTVRDNDIHGNGSRRCYGGGIGIFGAGYPHIVHNRIHDNSVVSGEGGGVYTGDAVIEENQIEDNSSGCCPGGLSVASGGHAVIGRNVLRGNSPYGLTVYGAGAFAYDNLIVGNQVGGAWVIANDAARIRFVNNTVADNAGKDILAFQSGTGTLLVVNNLVRTSQAGNSLSCIGTVTFKDNLVHATNGAGIAGCDAASGGLITDDPLLAGGSGPHAFWLTAGSPAIDAGNDKAAQRMRWDATGGARIVGGAVDLGAYEYRGESR